MNYYVYQYIDPRSNQVFYIGKGIGNRKNFHLNKVKNNPKVFNFKNHLSNTIKVILNSGFEPIIEIIENNLSELDALLLEKQLIEKFGRKNYDPNGILCNILLGNLVQGTVSEETREKLKTSSTGKVFTQERRNNISRAKIGKKNSKEHNLHVSSAVKKNWINNPEIRERHKKAKNDPSRNRSKIWLIEDLLSNTIIEVLGLNSWCKDHGWDDNDGQQLYRTLRNPDKIINTKYKSHGYRLIRFNNTKIDKNSSFV